MIDRTSRDELAEALRQYVSGRKRMLYHGTFLLILVILNALTKFILNQGTSTEWIITSVVGILGLSIVLISVYGSDDLVLSYFGKWSK